jgi:hypothetical protein
MQLRAVPVTVAAAVRALAPCPRCRVVIGAICMTPSGRNHKERVRAALWESVRAYERLNERLLGITRPG